jgi:uncharacterized protein YlxP (DUF503 family)
MEHLDAWQETGIACALVSNDSSFTRRSLQAIQHWVESNWPDVQVIDDQIEIF